MEEFSGIAHYEADTFFFRCFIHWHKKTQSRESFKLSDICSSVCVLHTEI